MTPDQWKARQLRRLARHEAAHAAVMEALSPVRGLTLRQVTERAYPKVQLPEDFPDVVLVVPWSRLEIIGGEGNMRSEPWAIEPLTPEDRAVLSMAGPVQDWLSDLEEDGDEDISPLSFLI